MLRNNEFHQFNIKVGRRIAEIRDEKGFSQAGLAEKMKVDVREVARWELGGAMTQFTIWRFSKALGCSPKDFYDEPKSLNVIWGRPREKKEGFDKLN